MRSRWTQHLFHVLCIDLTFQIFGVRGVDPDKWDITCNARVKCEGSTVWHFQERRLLCSFDLLVQVAFLHRVSNVAPETKNLFDPSSLPVTLSPQQHEICLDFIGNELVQPPAKLWHNLFKNKRNLPQIATALLCLVFFLDCSTKMIISTQTLLFWCRISYETFQTCMCKRVKLQNWCIWQDFKVWFWPSSHQKLSMPCRTFVMEIAYTMLLSPYIWHQNYLSQSKHVERDITSSASRIEIVLLLCPVPFAHVPWPEHT